jgi:hypothetical protein
MYGQTPVYHDELVRTDGSWQVAQRRADTVHERGDRRVLGWRPDPTRVSANVPRAKSPTRARSMPVMARRLNPIFPAAQPSTRAYGGRVISSHQFPAPEPETGPLRAPVTDPSLSALAPSLAAGLRVGLDCLADRSRERVPRPNVRAVTF